MDLPSLSAIGVVVAITVGLVGLWRGWWESPETRARRQRAELASEQNREIHSAILGEPARLDLSGHVIAEERPGLVALQRADSQRLAKVEEAVVAMNHLTGLFTEAMKRMDGHDGRLSEHDAAIAGLIAATFKSGADANLEAERLKRANVIDGKASE